MLRITLAFALSILLAPASRAVQIGDAAPELTLEALTNAPAGAADTSWDALEGKTIVLEFWGTWCGPCLAAIPHLNELRDALPEDEFTFISVTFEDVDLIERFLKKSTMKSWVGHDTDRSTVKAYDVKAWPTTFVIRDGMVVDRTFPAMLTEEKLHAYAGGAVAERRVQSSTNETVAAPGAEPVLSVVVTTSKEDPSRGMTMYRSLCNVTSNATSIKTIARWIWPGHWEYEFDLHDPDAHYDVSITAPDGSDEQIRSLLAAGLGLSARIETRAFDGYAARVAPGGITLDEPLVEHFSGASMQWKGDHILINSAAAPVSYIIETVERRLDGPVDDATGLDEDTLYFVELSLPVDRDALRQAVAEQVGLVLEPVRVERTVAVIRSQHNDDNP